jgi:hypothetical protein
MLLASAPPALTATFSGEVADFDLEIRKRDDEVSNLIVEGVLSRH